MPTLLFNKPFEVLTQFTDENGRSTLKDFVPIREVYPIGRLDYDSEGLILLTDNKELQHWLSHPKFKVPKTYWAQVEGSPAETDLEPLRKGGLVIGSDRLLPANARILPETPVLWERSKPIRYRASIPTTWIELQLTQGLNRQVRRMTAAIGFPTLRLVRTGLGPISLGKLQPGEWRELTSSEIEALQKAGQR